MEFISNIRTKSLSTLRLKKYICVFCMSLIYAATNHANEIEIKTNFAETTLITSAINEEICNAITHHFANVKLSDRKSIKPIEIWNDLGASYHSFPTGHSNNLIGSCGLDFTYNNFLMKKRAAGGILLGGFKSDAEFKSTSQYSDQDLKSIFTGIHGECEWKHINFSSATIFGTGKLETDLQNNHRLNINDYKKDIYYMHSYLKMSYQFIYKDIKIAPMIGYSSNCIKFKKDNQFLPKSVKSHIISGLGGITFSGHRHNLFWMSFTGLEYKFRQKLSDKIIEINGQKYKFIHEKIKRPAALITMELSYKANDKLFFNVNYSGKYNSQLKSSSLMFGVNKLF